MMRLRLPGSIRSIEDLLAFHRLSDEEILRQSTDPAHLDDRSITRLCVEARNAPGATLAELLAEADARIIDGSDLFPSGGIVWFGECDFPPGKPPVIAVNLRLIARIGDRLALIPDRSESVWFEPARLTELVVAHELYHIRQDSGRGSSGWRTEFAAHVFACSLTGWRYSPLLLDSIVRFTCRRDGGGEGRVEALSWN